MYFQNMFSHTHAHFASHSMGKTWLTVVHGLTWPTDLYMEQKHKGPFTKRPARARAQWHMRMALAFGAGAGIAG